MKEDRSNTLEMEEGQVKAICDAILALKLNLVITGAGGLQVCPSVV